jgi:hypothetical protein
MRSKLCALLALVITSAVPSIAAADDAPVPPVAPAPIAAPQDTPPPPSPPAAAKEGTSPAPSAGGTRAPAREGPPGRVFVHIDSGAPVVLERSEESGFVPVCIAPCDRWLPVDGEHRIAGAGVRPSARFSLYGNFMTASVAPASSARFAAGITLSVIGIAALLVGEIATDVWLYRDAFFLSDDDANAVLITAISSAVAGAGLIIGGLPLAIGNARTRVQTMSTSAPPMPTSAQPPPPRPVGFAAPLGSAPASGGSLVVPIVRWAF